MQERNHGSFDFIFVDADKDNYLNYHKRLIELVKVGGVIGYDNTLWNGSVVAPPDAPLRKYVRYYRDFVLELNKALAVDPRIEICMLPVGDGITICRRIKWLLFLANHGPPLLHSSWWVIIIKWQLRHLKSKSTEKTTNLKAIHPFLFIFCKNIRVCIFLFMFISNGGLWNLYMLEPFFLFGRKILRWKILESIMSFKYYPRLHTLSQIDLFSLHYFHLKISNVSGLTNNISS